MYHVWMQSYLRQKVFVRTMKDQVLTLENYNAMKTPAYPMAINQAELNASRQFRWHKQYGKTLCLQSMQSASVWKFFWIWNRVTFLASNQTVSFNILSKNRYFIHYRFFSVWISEINLFLFFFSILLKFIFQQCNIYSTCDNY